MPLLNTPLLLIHMSYFKRKTSPHYSKFELVLPLGSHIGKAGSVKTSGGSAKRGITKSAAIDMVLNCKMITVLANKARTTTVVANTGLSSKLL